MSWRFTNDTNQRSRRIAVYLQCRIKGHPDLGLLKVRGGHVTFLIEVIGSNRISPEWEQSESMGNMLRCGLDRGTNVDGRWSKDRYG